MHKPHFAVLLAAYNGMEYIDQQVKSILAQANVQVTLFISVDLSTDGTEQWCRALAQREGCVQMLPYGERFGGAAKNFFRLMKEVDFTPFDYIALSDQDDIWYDDKLAHAACVLIRDKADAYSSNVIAFWPNGQQRLIQKAQAQKKWDFLFEAAGPGCTYVLTKSLMQAIQSNLYAHWNAVQKVGLHDWYCYAFSRAQGYSWIVDARPGLLYRQHAANQVGVNRGLKAYQMRWKKIMEGWWLKQASLIATLVGLGNMPFVQKNLQGNRTGLLRLAFHAHQCRRKRREQVFFSLICLVLAISAA